MKEKLLKSDQGLQNANNENLKKKSKKYRPRKKLGRKRKKRLFDETRVGHFLKHEAPVEYDLIIDVCGMKTPPSADFIETIGYASLNPLFRKPKFRKALIEYRKNGLYSGPPKKSNAEVELYYINVRRNSVKKMKYMN